MLSKTFIAAAAFAATATASTLPTCWSDCFAKYEVDSEGCLCTDSLGDVVSSCIKSGCDSTDSSTYESWIASYCHEAPVSSNTYSAPSVTYSVPASSAYSSSYPASYPAASSSIPVYSAVSSSAVYSSVPVYSGFSSSVVVSAYPSSSSVVYPVSSSAPYASYSVCTETATLIYRSTTSYSAYTVTHTAGASGYGAAPSGYGAGAGSYSAGAWGGATGASGYGAATGTGAGNPASSYAPVPATGAGSKLAGAGLGAAAIVGGVAAVLL